MSDGEQLLLIFSLIYLSGCFFWVNRRTFLFSSSFGKTWKVVVADYRWGNSHGRPLLLNPLPPLGFACVARLLPVSISPFNIVAYNIQTVGNSGRPHQSGRIAKISPDTKFSRREQELYVDGKWFCDIGDIETTHKLVVLLNRIKRLDGPAREQDISRFWEERLDIHKTKNHIQKMLKASRIVRVACISSFFLFFILIPLSSIVFGLGIAVLFGAGAMLLSALAICIAYSSCHRRNYPTCKCGLGSDIAKMMLCPPNAIRACDLLLEKFSARLDALPLAILLLRGSERETFISEYFADLETADIPDDLSAVVRDTCLWQNREILKIGVTTWHGLKKILA